jgi:hypothetical protein
MATPEELQQQLRKSKKEKRELEQKIKEYEIREKLYLERLDNWAIKNQDLNYKINNMTIDDVVKIQKAKAEYTEKYLKDKQITESFEKQSQIKLGELGA